jgi:hypothetical protein
MNRTLDDKFALSDARLSHMVTEYLVNPMTQSVVNSMQKLMSENGYTPQHVLDCLCLAIREEERRLARLPQ